MLHNGMRQKLFVGPKIRQLREGTGLNQLTFAERVGISASYLNQIENNQRPLTAPVMLALAQTFQLDVNSFASEDTEKIVSDLREAIADPVFAGRTGRTSRRSCRARPGSRMPSSTCTPPSAAPASVCMRSTRSTPAIARSGR